METNPLSEREIDILKLVGQGKTNKEIAAELFISVNTVKVHISNIFQKIQVSSRTEATLFAIEHGIIRSPSIEVSSEVNASTETSQPATPEPSKTQFWLRRYLWILVLLGLLLVASLSALASRSTIFRTPTPTENPWNIVSLEQRWQPLPDLPVGVSNPALATFENNLYVFALAEDQQKNSVSLKFVTATQTWEALTANPHPASHRQAILLGEKFYLPGGKDTQGTILTNLEVYDPRTNRWSEGLPMPEPRFDYSAVAFEGKLYVFGGSDGSKVQSSAWVYDPELDNWQNLPPASIALQHAGIAETNGRIQLFGGNDGEKTINQSYSYNPARQGAEAWMQEPTLPNGFELRLFCGRGDSLFGIAVNTQNQFTLLQFAPGQKMWTQLPLPESVTIPQGAGSVLLENYLYVIGGFEAGQPTTHANRLQVIFTTMLPLIQN